MTKQRLLELVQRLPDDATIIIESGDNCSEPNIKLYSYERTGVYEAVLCVDDVYTSRYEHPKHYNNLSSF